MLNFIRLTGAFAASFFKSRATLQLSDTAVAQFASLFHIIGRSDYNVPQAFSDPAYLDIRYEEWSRSLGIGMAVNKDKSPRRKKPGKAPVKANASGTAAAKAINGIVASHKWAQGPLAEFAIDFPEAPPATDWPYAAHIIGSGLQRRDLASAKLLTLLNALDAASDRKSANTILEAVRVAVEAQWMEYGPHLRDAALKLLEQSSSRSDRGFETFLAAWPRLRSDRLLRTSAVKALASNLVLVGARLQSLQQLEGDFATARLVLCLCMVPDANDVNPDELASLLGAWAGNTKWGQVHHRLWWTEQAKECGGRPLTDVPAAVTEAVRHIEQLRLTGGRRRPELQLAEMAPESRAAWRRLLKRSVGSDEDLGAAVAEALLWYTAPVDDRQAQLAVMELYGREVRTALAPLREHCARIVRTRVESILGLVEGQPDVADLIDGRGAVQDDRALALDVPARIHEPRTWIGDARIEAMIEAAIASAADGYAREFESTADSGEETHVANLFRDVQHQFHAVNRRIATLAAESGANKRLVLRLDYRVVGKHEEGGPGVGPPSFSTDVCLLVQAREGTCPPFARRVSFIQAKRLHVREGANDVEYYPIKSEQLENLAEQTQSSYLLLIGPKRHDLVMPVLPARLVLDLIARGQLSSSLYPKVLPPISRGLASWLTYEAIGLWTGNWRPAALQRADGRKRRRPFLLVEITAEIRTAGADGWLP